MGYEPRWASGHLRSTADSNAAHPVSESMGEQTGNVVVHDLHLAALELSDLVQADLVLLRVLAQTKTAAVQFRGRNLNNREQLLCFYHFDGPERQQVVVLLAVAPGVPARILALLQDVHLAAEVHLLEAHVPAGRADSVSSFQGQNFEERLFGRNLRSRLDAQGANAVDAQLTYIHALVVDLNHATLEVLLVEHVHLRRRQKSAHQL